MRLLLATALLAVAGPAFAAVDYRPTITAPAGNVVYQTGRWNVRVSNIGNTNGSGGSLTIQLPQTHTSPQVYVMGTLGARSVGCTVAGTAMTCPLPAIRRGNSATFFFDIALPESAAPIVFTATTSNTQDTNATNNQTSATANPLSIAAINPGGHGAFIQHCTGTSLTAYYECTLFSGSITSHTHTFNADNTITFPGNYPLSYTGDWYPASADHLSFTYYDTGVPEVEFEGWGVGNNCFEGLTTFPGSIYVSPYRVCLQ